MKAVGLFVGAWSLAAIVFAQNGPQVSPAVLVKRVAAAPPWERVALAKQALDQYPNYPPLLVLLGDALTFEGDDEEARAVFQRCLDLVPEHATALRGSCRLGQLIVDSNLGQHQRAHQGVLELLQGPPLYQQDRFKARRLLFHLLLGMGRLHEAEELLAELEHAADAVELDQQETIRAAEVLLRLGQGRYADVLRQLPALDASHNRSAWFTGVVARIYMNHTADLAVVLEGVPAKEIPACCRNLAEALRMGLRGQPWRETIAKHLARFPHLPTGYLFGAWLARSEGLDWTTYFQEASRKGVSGWLLHPPWRTEVTGD